MVTVFCRPPLMIAPCRTNGQCWGHDGCVGFYDCSCTRCRNARMQDAVERDPRLAAMMSQPV